MNDFVRCNKLSGIYWIKGQVDDIKIEIKLKPPDDILSLPKFEDYTNESRNINLDTSVEKHTFIWQEKAFSAWEIQRYSDVHNCLTETELEYNNIIENNEITSNKIFTYVHEDYHLPLPKEFKKVNSKLETCFEKLSLRGAVGRIEESFGGKTVSVQHLFSKSDENVYEDEKWSAMHVVLDNSDYNEDGQLLLKKEFPLLSIYYNVPNRYVILSPDVNDLELNPYTVDDAVVPLGYKYEVQVDFGEKGNSGELEVLLKKLHKNWEKKHKAMVKFLMPPLGKKQYCVSVEIVSAAGFDMDHIYIEYHLKLPDGIECTDTLHGRTHTSQSLTVDDEEVWHFGHIIELNIDASAGFEPNPIHITLEVISTDWWMRHRTEGYATFSVPLTPGMKTENYPTLVPGYTCGDNQRRLLVGGCHLLNNDKLKDPSIVQTSSGTVCIRSSVMSQSARAGGFSSDPPHSSATALLLGAETALRKYKKARAKLAAATKNIAELGFGDGNVDTI